MGIPTPKGPLPNSHRIPADHLRYTNWELLPKGNKIVSLVWSLSGHIISMPLAISDWPIKCAPELGTNTGVGWGNDQGSKTLAILNDHPSLVTSPRLVTSLLGKKETFPKFNMHLFDYKLTYIPQLCKPSRRGFQSIGDSSKGLKGGKTIFQGEVGCTTIVMLHAPCT